MSIEDIDFGRLYRDHMARTAKKQRSPADWDARARTMSRGVFTGAYVDGLVTRLDLADCATLLDVGCGPGTISLRAAPRLAQVYGLDFSPGMLASFAENAAARGLSNAAPILRAWEDDWTDVPVCDVVVASRSTSVADLEAALIKLHAHARRRVYVTQLASGALLDAEMYAALGRDIEPRPDYTYAFNILRQLGIRPAVDYLEGESRWRKCADAEDFLRKVTWSLGDLTPDERERLRRYYEQNRERLGRSPVWWALISWDKDRAG